MNIPDAALKALTVLNDAGYEAYLVGGCVRDYYMDRAMNDIDITTSAFPEETKQAFNGYKVIETGIKHGTVTVLIDGEPCEITTYRTEGVYSDNRHPDSVTFTRTLSEDLSRRDFTMNALCCDKEGNIVDLFDGRKDIDNKIIRCIGDADKRLSEDALRIFRAVRFASVLGFSIEKDTSDALIRNRNLLKNIASERIYVELIKAIQGDNIKSVLLDYFAVFCTILPELEPMKGFEQHNPHHIYDVLTHTAVVVENVPPLPLLRLSALFHDIGKPDTFFIDKKGIGHFYGHGEKSKEITAGIMHRLKASNADTDFVTEMVKYHDIQLDETERAVRRFLSKHGELFTRQLVLLKKADNAGQNKRLYDYTDYYEGIDRLVDVIVAEQQCFTKKDLAVNGTDLICEGIPRGKILGGILTELFEKVLDGELPNEKGVLTRTAMRIYNSKQ